MSVAEGIRLPTTATTDEIAAAIRTVQKGCRSRLVDPDAVALDARIGWGRVEAIARTLDTEPGRLHPRATYGAWSQSDSGVTTLVSLSQFGFYVRRWSPSTTESPGLLTLSIPSRLR